MIGNLHKAMKIIRMHHASTASLLWREINFWPQEHAINGRGGHMVGKDAVKIARPIGGNTKTLRRVQWRGSALQVKTRWPG